MIVIDRDNNQDLISNEEKRGKTRKNEEKRGKTRKNEEYNAKNNE